MQQTVCAVCPCAMTASRGPSMQTTQTPRLFLPTSGFSAVASSPPFHSPRSRAIASAAAAAVAPARQVKQSAQLSTYNLKQWKRRMVLSTGALAKARTDLDGSIAAWLTACLEVVRHS